MIRYAKERKAFGKPIAEFGLIQRKISPSAARLYAAESMAYRTAGMIDARLAQLGDQARRSPREIQKRIEEYAVECSILKVYGSEMLCAGVPTNWCRPWAATAMSRSIRPSASIAMRASIASLKGPTRSIG